MTPRALHSSVFAMARPARPSVERQIVHEAADQVRAETGLNAAEPIARIIAARTVDALKAYLAEDMDPLLAAAGEFQRRTAPTPYDELATNPDIDSIALFVEARVERVRTRSGRTLSVRDDETECREIWTKVRDRLSKRYTRLMRASP